MISTHCHVRRGINQVFCPQVPELQTTWINVFLNFVISYIMYNAAFVY